MKTKKENESLYSIISLISKYKTNTLLKMLYHSKNNFNCTYPSFILACKDSIIIANVENINISYTIKYQNIEKIYITLSKDYYTLTSNKAFLNALKYIDIIFSFNGKKYTISLDNDIMYVNTNLEFVNISFFFECLNFKLNKEQIEYKLQYNN